MSNKYGLALFLWLFVKAGGRRVLAPGNRDIINRTLYVSMCRC
ncbi:hypothetical protein [Nitrosomonas sp.]|nr:hypothetical protein [Nitrosomonas sp.]